MLTSLKQGFSDRLVRSPLVPLPRRAEEETIDYATAAVFKGPSQLKPPSELKTKLLGWPETPFSPTNCVSSEFGHEPHKQVTAGMPAVDFELASGASGSSTTVALSALLAPKEGETLPVLLCAVSKSCPHCMAFKGAMEAFAAEYAGRVRCVAVVIMQPHPMKPEASFENGKTWEMPYSKGVAQARTLEARLEEARLIQGLLPSWTVLADDLPPGEEKNEDHLVNPFWSTYGPAPRCAFLVDAASGLVCHSQLWWEPARTRKAVEAYLKAKAAAAEKQKDDDGPKDDDDAAPAETPEAAAAAPAETTEAAPAAAAEDAGGPPAKEEGDQAASGPPGADSSDETATSAAATGAEAPEETPVAPPSAEEPPPTASEGDVALEDEK